jgi:hypothetical protein
MVFETGLFAGWSWIPGPARKDAFMVLSGGINNEDLVQSLMRCHIGIGRQGNEA